MKKFSLAIHGGAGTILKSAMTAQKELAYRDTLEAAISCGQKILVSGGSALDAVEVAVMVMEDSDLFNAGLGSVFTHDRSHELDASIMDGNGRRAGAVAGISRVKNPILLCRKIMERSDHVFLVGAGAEEFAEEHGVKIVEPQYFSTDFREAQLLKIRDSGKTQLDHADAESKKYGTVGAVALDMDGNLAAATSTGGITNKRYGRVGDTAVIGSGTYAENGVCAVSSTGWGEFYLRAVAAYDVAAMMKYGKRDLAAATNELIHKTIPGLGGDGGLIAVDAAGNIAMPFNTKGMYRAKIGHDKPLEIGIYE